jgi:ATP-binding cassette, subfamily B, multidrug efflux pump
MIDKDLALVGLTDIVKNLPQGLNTPVSDINLSLQLLMIARSVVCDPQILLLDEMTASLSLDRETEAKVLKTIDAASSGLTVLSISHRRGAHDGRIIKL